MKFRVTRASDDGDIYSPDPDAPVPVDPPEPPLQGATFAGWSRYRIPASDPHRNPHVTHTPIWALEVNDLDALLALAAQEGCGLIARSAPDLRDRHADYEPAAAERDLPSITIYDYYVE